MLCVLGMKVWRNRLTVTLFLHIWTSGLVKEQPTDRSSTSCSLSLQSHTGQSLLSTWPRHEKTEAWLRNTQPLAQDLKATWFQDVTSLPLPERGLRRGSSRRHREGLWSRHQGQTLPSDSQRRQAPGQGHTATWGLGSQPGTRWSPEAS